ncbi:MAG: hypothetical protein HKP61_07825 [Dactylosporangium sp.]|nr:hypothetical protein [Dactylosporangium sp.]NNJ60845.1 hypothetical protein [Dactylosporangium sp.]
MLAGLIAQARRRTICSEPPGAQHWANATGLAKNPLLAWWRSAQAPVWSHRIHRPALVWDETGGVWEETLAALRNSDGATVRVAAPAEDVLRARLHDELAVSPRTLRACPRAFNERRWRPGTLEPIADARWRASNGYLDVLDAIG